MRRSQEDTAETHRKIVAAASQLFRERGIEATSVADVMSAVGLTVGGFYRHFESKEALVAEAIDSASRATTAHLSPRTESSEIDLVPLIDNYLSDLHRKNPGHGCPVAALCSEVGHESKSTKKAFTVALERLLGVVDSAIGKRSKDRRKSVLFAASAAVGALVLARATQDESLAGELLSAVRDRLLYQNRKEAPSRKGAGIVSSR
jgi:TetR/AcrR family transcriptional repressor of nem operon